MAKRTKKAVQPSTVYELRITLLGVHPPIWRTIHVGDCTLDELHECIQTAMGWTNSHLHEFIIDDERCGDPDLLVDEWSDPREVPRDSLTTRLSQILKGRPKGFRFLYRYDFGDDWEHEIKFEGTAKPATRTKYPWCVAGERACPPEDIGGAGGYEEFLEAATDPNHEQYESMLEWRGPFDPEAFSPTEATKAMRRGLPRWRD